jgi:hypothetical protein
MPLNCGKSRRSAVMPPTTRRMTPECDSLLRQELTVNQ